MYNSNENIAKILIKEGFKLEFHSDAGKYNLIFTIGLFVLSITYIGLADWIIALIYAVFLHVKYSPPTIVQIFCIPVIWGLVCFLFMVWMAYKQWQFKDDIKKINK